VPLDVRGKLRPPPINTIYDSDGKTKKFVSVNPQSVLNRHYGLHRTLGSKTPVDENTIFDFQDTMKTQLRM